VFTQLRYFPEKVDDRLSRGNGSFKTADQWGLDLNWNSDRSRPLSVNAGVNVGQEDLGDRRMQYFGGFTWQPNDRFVLETNLRYTDSDGWLIHQGSGRMTTFESSEWAPRLNMDYFINAKQQLRFSLQWTGIKAFEKEFYQVDPYSVSELINTGKTTATTDNFVVSRMSFQARYRWEIAPLSDLFFVYTRGGNLARDFQDDYMGLFANAWQNEVVDNWVLKLRYRLGS